MSKPLACASVVASVGSNPTTDSSSKDGEERINLRMDGDDPYVGFKEFPPLDYCEIEKDEEMEMEEEVEEFEAAKAKFEPCVGMEFETEKQAYDFYNTYAGHVGFSVRKNNQKKSKDVVTFCRFVCNKACFSKHQIAEQKGLKCAIEPKSPQRERGTTRTNCKAAISIKLVKEGHWVVSVFHSDHNHQLLTSPSKNRNLRSQKVIDEEEDDIICGMSAQNIGTSKIYEYIAEKWGGKKQLRYKKKDVSNRITTQNRQILGMDVGSTLAYFKQKQQEDPEFFYDIDADENGLTRHIFWVDGRGRRAYLEFGDVVTFDTTYNTNRYNMPLAPFLGVNHHRQTMFFGVALIRGEKEMNFTWLFETFLKAMYGKYPRSILTDQDPAMKNAIKAIFPNTTHRCCQWHVMRKAREKFLKLYASKDGLEYEFKAVVNRSLTISEFEEAWGKLLEKYKIKNAGHWKVIYDKRDEWVPAFFRDKFFADMSTTQRSESMNMVLKLWLNNHTSIFHFVQKVEMMIEGIWNLESDLDIRDINETPKLWSPFTTEHDAREVYTKRNYKVFKEILIESCKGIVIEHERDKRYEVSIRINRQVRNWVPESFIVDVDKENEMYSCNCKGFIFEGFLCQHAIKVLHHVGEERLPDRYILKRWCKGANANVKRNVEERCRGEGEVEAIRAFKRTKLYLLYKKIEDIAADDASGEFEEALSRMQALENDLASRKKQTIPLQVSAPLIEEYEKSENPSNYLDPPLSQCKGRKKVPVRWKPTGEKITKKGRTCSYCHAKEQHNIRTCPKRIKDACKGKKQVDIVKEESEFEDGDGLSEEESAI